MGSVQYGYTAINTPGRRKQTDPYRPKLTTFTRACRKMMCSSPKVMPVLLHGVILPHGILRRSF